MKKLLLAVVLVVGIATFAQERNEQDGKEKGEKRERMTPEQRTQLQLKKITIDLKLNDSQQKEVAKLLKDRETKIEAMKAERQTAKESGKRPSADERFAMKNRMLDEQKEMKDKLAKILNPEQLAKWEQKQADRKDKMQERMDKRKSKMENPDNK